jgi:hypothetical protein
MNDESNGQKFYSWEKFDEWNHILFSFTHFEKNNTNSYAER